MEARCPYCEVMVPLPKNTRRKCPACREWLAVWWFWDGSPSIYVTPEEKKRRMEVWDAAKGREALPSSAKQRADFKRQCAEWATESYIRGVYVAPGSRCDEDPHCVALMGVVTPIKIAAKHPPLPCKKPHCFCYLQPVFEDEDAPPRPTPTPLIAPDSSQ